MPAIVDAALLRPIESLLNRRIGDSTPAQDLCKELDGRNLAVALQGTAITLYIHVTPDGLRLLSEYKDDPDAVFTASVTGFAALARGDAAAGELKFEGDPEVARQFQALLQHARPDFEEELSRLVGDVAAHQIGSAIRGAMQWGKRTFRSAREDTADYLKEESGALPARPEIDRFSEDVTEAHKRVEQAEARLARLEKRLRRG